MKIETCEINLKVALIRYLAVNQGLTLSGLSRRLNRSEGFIRNVLDLDQLNQETRYELFDNKISIVDALWRLKS